ncbi:MAG: hypothetical protein LC714_00830 [Actinobacteria bacterium]|nr:hypothetical protein [Actinomycetota bacterium]
MNVHESREEVQAVGFHLSCPPQTVADLGYPARRDAHVGNGVDPGTGVEDVSMTDDQFGGVSDHAATSWAAPVARARTAERTWVPAAT